MPIFKLKKDDLIQQWWRDYYEVEAETKEEAVQLILDCEVEPYDSAPLLEGIPDPLETEIIDEDGTILYSDEEDK